MPKNTGIEYEKLTQKIFSEIINQKTVENIKVEHDVYIQGKSTKHQIDVYWEFDFNGINYRTIIQAKDWKSKVPQSEMLSFKAVLDDLPSGTKGIYVTRTGYQSGARDVAEKHGISLYILREPTEEDWEGRVKKFIINLVVSNPVYNNLKIDIDGQWARENIPNMSISGKMYDANTELYDINRKCVCTLKELLENMAKKSPENIIYQNHMFEKDTFIQIEGDNFAKITSISGDIGYSISKKEIVIDGEKTIGLILKDILEDRIFTFDKQQNLLGGNKNE